MEKFIAWVVEHKTLEFGVLFIISECLALIPAVQANSVFQMIFGWIKKQKEAVAVEAPKV